MTNDHTDHVIQWRNDPLNAIWFRTENVFTKSGHESWLTAQVRKGTDFNWIIVDLKGSPVGALGIYNIDWGLRKAEFGRFVVDGAARGRGIGCEAMKLALSLAKSSGLSEIYLTVRSTNINAINLYDKIGFQHTKTEDEYMMMTLNLSQGLN
jgi:RimJ/RimL family protein N-acetyltransferase